jgi:hypothetical protein
MKKKTKATHWVLSLASAIALMCPNLLIGQSADSYAGAAIGSDGRVYGYAVTEGAMSGNGCCMHTYMAHVQISSPGGAWSGGASTTAQAPSYQSASLRADDSIALDDGGDYTVYYDGTADCTIAGTFFSTGQQQVAITAHATFYSNTSFVISGGPCPCKICNYAANCALNSQVCGGSTTLWAVTQNDECPQNQKVFYTASCGEVWREFNYSRLTACY